ncbi:extracellular solute-binding protein [Paenibacillus spiritus]|uniref:Extracellular solute-binding protein n=1 Tax=Paenibacillus spiritus TaxID=2496557 RepID=A0A5J5GIX2_9BACL|nr:extracellular solute-binding protein [Paenibacillus spiritus]KAA9007572.1 extracellular solute-binding protein [Paenibacillus spiritus]
MSRTTRIIGALSAVMISTAAMAGCSLGGAGADSGSKEPAAATASPKVTIHMMHLWPAESSAQQYKLVSQIIGEYETEHPGIRIEQEVLENEQYKNKLKILSASNELPDVGITWAAGSMEPFVKANLFAPLDDLLIGPELGDQFVPGTTEAFAVDGSTYALPLELNISPVYYNKELFARYGLKVPTTYDELKSIVRTLTDNGVAPIALGNKDRWTGSLWYMYLADRIAGSEALKQAISGKASFQDPAFVKAAKEVQNLVKMNAFYKEFNGLSNEEGKSVFVSEKAAMYLTGTWELPNFTTNPEIPQSFRDKVGFFKFPTYSGGKGSIDSWVGGPGVGLFVAEESAVKEEAKAFVQYFISKWGEEAVATAGVIPATKVDTGSAGLPELYVDLLNELNRASSLTLFADVQMKPGAAQAHLDMIQALFGMAMTPEQFAAKHKEWIEKGI